MVPFKVDVLKANLLDKAYADIEIKSVDGFQGREKEVVIISMVRSNKPQNLGFLVEKRRLNVAVTRAKRQLVLVCDAKTVSKVMTGSTLLYCRLLYFKFCIVHDMLRAVTLASLCLSKL